jgi:hypothetical protein
MAEVKKKYTIKMGFSYFDKDKKVVTLKKGDEVKLTKELAKNYKLKNFI